MSNLVDLVKDQLGSAVLGKVASMMGVNQNLASSAVDAFIPSLLSGVLDKGSTQSGVSSILDLITKNDLGGGVLDNLGDLLGGGSKTDSFLSMGTGLISALFGGNGSSIIDKLLSIGGLGRGNTSKLLSVLAPIALSVIGKMVKSKGLNAGSLLSFFSNQRSNINSALPVGFAASSARRSNVVEDNDNGGGMGWLKWLLPLLILGLLAWYFFGRGKADADVKTTDKMEHVDKKGKMHDDKMKKGDAHAGHDHDAHAGHNHAKGEHGKADAKEKMTQINTSYRIDPKGNVLDQYGFIVYSVKDLKKDDAGNIIDKNGKIIIPVGKIKGWTVKTAGKKSPKLSVDANGNLVDGTGKILFKKGEFKQEGNYYVDSKGNRIGFFKKIGEAIGKAATATVDAFKKTFSGLFAKKDKTNATYKLNRMDFNKENHRLTYYSKPEIEGLVAALKATPGAKVQVRVHTIDGKNEKANLKLSENRANVVRDMMTTLLGQNKNQISFKGMGSSDPAKAAKQVVEVVVE